MWIKPFDWADWWVLCMFELLGFDIIGFVDIGCNMHATLDNTFVVFMLYEFLRLNNGIFEIGLYSYL